MIARFLTKCICFCLTTCTLQKLHDRSLTATLMQVLMNEGIDRRRRFISTVACALGIGVIINPGWATDNLWVATPTMSSGVRAVRYCFVPSLQQQSNTIKVVEC